MSKPKHHPQSPEEHEKAAHRCEEGAKHMAVAATKHRETATALRAGDHAKAAESAAAAGEAHLAADAHMQAVAAAHPTTPAA